MNSIELQNNSKMEALKTLDKKLYVADLLWVSGAGYNTKTNELLLHNKERVETGVEKFNSKYAPVIWMSENDGCRQMKNYAASMGVDESKICLDDISTTTRTSIQELAKRMVQYDLDSVGIVSSYWHKRIPKMAEEELEPLNINYKFLEAPDSRGYIIKTKDKVKEEGALHVADRDKPEYKRVRMENIDNKILKLKEKLKLESENENNLKVKDIGRQITRINCYKEKIKKSFLQ